MEVTDLLARKEVREAAIGLPPLVESRQITPQIRRLRFDDQRIEILRILVEQHGDPFRALGLERKQVVLGYAPVERDQDGPPPAAQASEGKPSLRVGEGELPGFERRDHHTGDGAAVEGRHDRPVDPCGGIDLEVQG